jgi:hypothetical protein
MVDSMRVRLDQCKEVLLIAGELESYESANGCLLYTGCGHSVIIVVTQ